MHRFCNITDLSPLPLFSISLYTFRMYSFNTLLQNYNLIKFKMIHTISLWSAFDVHISQLIRYSRAVYVYDVDLNWTKLLTNELQKSAFHKPKGRYNDLINKYELPLHRLLPNMLSGNLKLFFTFYFSYEILYGTSLKYKTHCEWGLSRWDSYCC